MTNPTESTSPGGGENSKWSEKNKALAVQLERQGLMTDFGREKIEAARESGRWDAPKASGGDAGADRCPGGAARGHEPAHSNFWAMPLSVRKTYTRAYLDAKTDAGREKRLNWMLDRLSRNLRPM